MTEVGMQHLSRMAFEQTNLLAGSGIPDGHGMATMPGCCHKGFFGVKGCTSEQIFLAAPG